MSESLDELRLRIDVDADFLTVTLYRPGYYDAIDICSADIRLAVLRRAMAEDEKRSG